MKVESDLGQGIARLLSLATLLAVLGLLGTLGWLFVVYPDSDGPEGEAEEVILEVHQGMTLRPLANQLETEGVLQQMLVHTD